MLKVDPTDCSTPPIESEQEERDSTDKEMGMVVMTVEPTKGLLVRKELETTGPVLATRGQVRCGRRQEHGRVGHSDSAGGIIV
jgi:hypothetical protein